MFRVPLSFLEKDNSAFDLATGVFLIYFLFQNIKLLRNIKQKIQIKLHRDDRIS